jgi:hypothetical protein
MLTILLVAAAGVNSLLMPASPAGVLSGFAVARNAEAIFYNPAHFRSADAFRLDCYYNRFYLGMQSFALALSRQYRSLDLGLGITNFDYGDIEWRPDYPTEDPLLDYSANDFVFMVCGSVPISPQGRLGLAVKYVAENLYLYSDQAIAFDLSLAYRRDRFGFSFGCANLGTKLELNDDEVNLPARFSAGLSYRLAPVEVGLEGHYFVNRPGLETALSAAAPVYRRLELSAGLRWRYRDPVFPAFGLALDLERTRLSYGVALYPYSLGLVNTLGLHFDF